VLAMARSRALSRVRKQAGFHLSPLESCDSMLPIMTFLRNPNAIRRALADGLRTARFLDAAVAFVGRDWLDLLGNFDGKVRFVCWLTSTNTNPYAVEQMVSRGISVRHLDAMHAKVYLCSGDGDCLVIVGSANLSAAALADYDNAGQYEAAVGTREADMCRDVQSWFDGLWSCASPVHESDVDAAKRAWDAAREREPRGRHPRHAGPAADAESGRSGEPPSTEDDEKDDGEEDKSPTTIFRPIILDLLRRHSPQNVGEICDHVRALRPDLCNDAVKRKTRTGRVYNDPDWRHKVRTANAILQTSGLIFYDKESDTWSAATAHS
jgi:HKD family nuclease